MDQPDPQIGDLTRIRFCPRLYDHLGDMMSTGATSDAAERFGHGILAGLDVDWLALGMDDGI